MEFDFSNGLVTRLRLGERTMKTVSVKLRFVFKVIELDLKGYVR